MEETNENEFHFYPSDQLGKADEAPEDGSLPIPGAAATAEPEKNKKKRSHIAVWIVIAAAILFSVQYFWVGSSEQMPEISNVTAIVGEALTEDTFVNKPAVESSPFFDIAAKFITIPDTNIIGETPIYIFLYNRIGYVNIVKANLDVVEGSLKTHADAELTAGEITISDFVYTQNASAELVSVSGAPEFDDEANAYIFKCVIRLGSREVPCELSVFDKTPPEITGVRDIEVQQNTTILFREGIEVRDNYDGNARLSIESDAQPAKPGNYTVTYSAVDESGNRTEATANVKVTSAEAEWVREKVDEILASILTEGMDQGQIVRAIYRWIRSSIRYGAAPVEDDAVMGTHVGLTKRVGDCFTFYAVSEVMLTQAGIENMRIQRVPDAAVEHYWNLVNIGEGWYHFDACPPFVVFDGCLFTESQAREYAVWQSPYRAQYFDYIVEDYPPIVQ